MRSPFPFKILDLELLPRQFCAGLGDCECLLWLLNGVGDDRRLSVPLGIRNIATWSPSLCPSIPKFLSNHTSCIIPTISTTSTQCLTLILNCYVTLVHFNNTITIYKRHDKYEFPDFVKYKVGSYIVGSLSNTHYLPSKWNIVTYNVDLQCYILWVAI